MRDYTVNRYCDFLWINDLLELKSIRNFSFVGEVKKNNTIPPIPISVSNVIIFGTIVEIKEVGDRGCLYYVDDGTGVIVCKHSTAQFEELVNLIENEQADVLNQTFQFKQCSDQSSFLNSSLDDSVFNDRSIQVDELDENKKSQLRALQSIWGDIYESFYSLISHYSIGDTVYIEGKLYNYFGANQIYINNIRLMSLTEELMKVSIKLEDGFESLVNVNKKENESIAEKRLSGLMTFDHIQSLNSKIQVPKIVTTPERKPGNIQMDDKVVTPHLESTITFDTLNNKR